ncbi:hypothetical protein EDD11_009555 [Mortierella claussenii]|nr:hypothetical protein EDD11_009555 [Mortierella claussenii]
MYFAMGCIIPYYVMKHAEDEALYQQGLKMDQQEELLNGRLDEGLQQPWQQQAQQPEGGGQETGMDGSGAESAIVLDSSNPKGYRRRAFFEDLDAIASSDNTPTEAVFTLQQPKHIHHTSHTESQPIRPLQPGSDTSSAPQPLTPTQIFYQTQQSHRKEILNNMNQVYAAERQAAKLHKIKKPRDYTRLIDRSVWEARKWILFKMPVDYRHFNNRIPGTKLNTAQKTKRFRQLMDEALNQGRWVYDHDRDYPDFGGLTGWSKNMKNERTRDVAINRPPFPEAGKYHWEPLVSLSSKGLPEQHSHQPSQQQQYSLRTAAEGWLAYRIEREDFCNLLGPRHIILVGDMIHWQLHDSILYNMFDTPQICYGDLACHLGAGHPLCPLPNDVRLKFVRNDVLSSPQPQKSRLNETKTQDPVEMSWLRDMKLKDTIILGATHFTMPDKLFWRQLTDTVIKIRKARPEALIIYRNNPVGHPDCPSKANGFNSGQTRRPQKLSERQKQKQKQKQQKGSVKAGQSAFRNKKKLFPLAHSWTTFSAPAEPFTQDIPLAEMLDFPLDWVHYDRQNRMAKEIVEATGGIYWNVATMTNMRPDGHVGGQDCLSYKRPGPTDEWALSLYNLFKAIDLVEREFSS